MGSMMQSLGWIMAVWLPLNVMWRPILPISQIILLAFVLVAASCFGYLRSLESRPLSRVGLLLMRLVVALACTLFLMGPSKTVKSRQVSQPSSLSVVLDVSDSMLVDDCQGQRRLDVARSQWLRPDWIRQLRAECEVEVFAFAEELVPFDPNDLDDRPFGDQAGYSTFLGRSLIQAIKEQRRSRDSALLVLSDGHETEDTAINTVTSLANARNVPIHVVSFGTQNQQQDLTLITVPLQDYLLPGEPGAILVKAYQFGMPQANTTLRFRHGDTEQSIPLEFRGRRSIELQLEVREDEPGQYDYEVSIEPVAGEAETKNNHQTVFCEVAEKRLKVLVLEGQPYWDTKFLAQSLRKDERIELTQVTQVADDSRETLVSRAEGDAVNVPRTVEEWSQYDVVVLGNNVEHVLSSTAAEGLEKFVTDAGGHLVWARGRCYDPDDVEGRAIGRALSNAEPVVWEDDQVADVQIQVVPRSVDTSWMANDKMRMDVSRVFRTAPGFQRLQGVASLKPGTVVLAEADSEAPGQAERRPAIVTMQAGRGRVVALMGSGSWRWSLRPPDQNKVDNFYDIFWSNMVRWLVFGGDFSPGQQATLNLSRQSLRLDDSLAIEVAFKDPLAANRPWNVVWQGPSGKSQRVSMKRSVGRAPRFRAVIEPNESGVHTVRLTTPSLDPVEQVGRFNVYDVNLERLETSARPDILRAYADGTGGKFFDVNDRGQLLQVLKRQRLARQMPPETEYIWDQAGVMLLLLAWLGGEWLLRRLVGLL